MTAPKKTGPRSKVCASQVACDGTWVSHVSGFDACSACRQKLAARAKPPKPLRGQRCIETYQGRL